MKWKLFPFNAGYDRWGYIDKNLSRLMRVCIDIFNRDIAAGNELEHDCVLPRSSV